MADTSKAIWRETPDPDFLKEILAMPGGEAVGACIQCGTCSGACPTARDMDYSPRQIMALIRAGYREQVLASNMIWMCASCYSCYVKCPKEIKLTDFFYKLKQMAMREGYENPASRRAQVLAKKFAGNVRWLGRSNEMWLLVKYFLSTNIFSALKYTGMGLSLFTTGRLELIPKKSKSTDDVRKITDKCREGAAMRS
ncbi:MAG: 4Fe-4S dicluster domain-containing protein [Candidatus Zixiibacteriota bacterium]|jgi:heterodisulfide reductase subunit C